MASERRCDIAATLGCLAFFSVIIAAAAHLHSRNDRLSNVHLSPVVRAIPPVEVLVSVRSTGYKNVYCTQLPPPADRGPTPRPTNFFGVADLKLLFALIPAMLFMFFGLAIVVDDFLVPSLEALCEQLHLLEDVAGATLMAAGSSAPELCMGLLAVFGRRTTLVSAQLWAVLFSTSLSLLGCRQCLRTTCSIWIFALS